MSLFNRPKAQPQTPPTEQEVFQAFEEAQRGAPEAYQAMDFDTFFYGFLIGKGWSGADAAKFVQENPVGEGAKG